MFSKLRGGFVEVVERPGEALGARVWRFPRGDDEIKTGALLIVREREAAVLADGERIADGFSPGSHTLEADHLPLLASLQGWARDRGSPFKAEVYFVSTGPFADVEWSTPEPVAVRDPEFGRFRLGARGVCEVRVANAARLLRESGVVAEPDPDEAVGVWVRERVAAAFAAAAASADAPARATAARPGESGEELREAVARQLVSAGLELRSFTVEELSPPPEVEAALRERAARGSADEALADPGGTGPDRPSAAAEWYLGLDGRQVGPFGEEELRERAASGELTPQTLVRRSGQDEWSAAGAVPELAGAVDSAPR